MAYNCYSPAETISIVSRTGVAKGSMRLDKVFFSSVSAGCLLAFACATALSTNSSPWYQENAPGLIKTISALFTTVSVLQRRLSVVKMLIHWTVTFLGNLAGSLFIVAIITGYGGVFDTMAYHEEAIKFATAKQVAPEWYQIFIRGIGANWLVCLACFLGMSGREYFSKIIGIWWPTFAFVSLGLDHVVANMFFIPMGIWQGTPKITVGLYIWKGIIPAFIGNVIGGALFVGAYSWYQHMQGHEPAVIDGVAYGEGVAGNTVELGRRNVSNDEEMLNS